VRRDLALLAAGCLVVGLAGFASAQVNPPVAAPTGAVNPPGIPTPAAPEASAPAGAPAPDQSPLPADLTSPAPGASVPPVPVPTPTQPPITTDPALPAVEPGKTIAVRINSAAGTVTATVADPAIVTATVDQVQRALFLTGVAVGSTTVTLGDSRGVTRDVLVRVAYAAGTIAPSITIHVTGDPASVAFLREAAIAAATDAATLRPGARVFIPDVAIVHNELPLDDHSDVDVPMQLLGETYFTVNGSTHVTFVNDALPRIGPAQLLVSDYPERLTADGVLFTATIDRQRAQRFLYYHYNPSTEPGRRILVKVTNSSATPAVVHLIAALAGPASNEMEVGHTASKTFMVRERRNEGTIITIPPHATVNVINHPLPPNSIVNGLFQMREVTGDPLDLTIVAQDAASPLDQSVDRTLLLAGGAAHARGVYPVPEFFSDYTFFVDAPALEIPIGQLPLPNLREGETLSGDYGVKQSLRVVIVNPSRTAVPVALYANPRGGAATGTFIIDNTLVQAHRLPAFSKYKIWQETIPPGTYRTLQVTTIPEGGSSYPLRLIFAEDDGSVAPGAPNSPVY
jgi:hypothetical protein